MDARQDFAFTINVDTLKLVTVVHRSSAIDVTVRYTADVVLYEATTRIRNAIGPTIETDENGVVVAWRAPLLLGTNWPIINRRRRF